MHESRTKDYIIKEGSMVSQRVLITLESVSHTRITSEVLQEPLEYALHSKNIRVGVLSVHKKTMMYCRVIWQTQDKKYEHLTIIQYYKLIHDHLYYTLVQQITLRALSVTLVTS